LEQAHNFTALGLLILYRVSFNFLIWDDQISEKNYSILELLTEWINETYIRRNGAGLDLTGMNIFWSFVVSSVAIGAIIGALLVR